MIYIATTTINKPTKALKKFANNNNCKLIVALDKKSKPFKLKNSIVLSTEYQNKKCAAVLLHFVLGTKSAKPLTQWLDYVL